MGKTITHFGATGAGQAAKATNQIMVAGIIRANAEAMAFAAAHGLDARQGHRHPRAGRRRNWYLTHRGRTWNAAPIRPDFRVRAPPEGPEHLPRHGGASAGPRCPWSSRCCGEYAQLIARGLRGRGHLHDLSIEGGAVRARPPRAEHGEPQAHRRPFAESARFLRGARGAGRGADRDAHRASCWRSRASTPASASGSIWRARRCSCCGSGWAAPPCCACCACAWPRCRWARPARWP